MSDFWQAQLSTQNIFVNLGWIVIGAIFTRLWAWMRGWEPKRWKFFFFWIFVPITILLVQWMFAYAGEIRRRPVFKSGIDGVLVGESTEQKLVQLGVQMWIVNTGAPSIARDWSAYVAASQGNRLACTIVNPLEVQYGSGKSGNKIEFGPEKSIILKSSEMPIPAGGEALGFLWMRLPDKVTRSFYETQGKTIVVIFHDAYGIEYQTSYPATGPYQTELP